MDIKDLRIMIVDDDATQLDRLELILKGLGVKSIEKLNNGRDACWSLTSAAAGDKAFNLILCDSQMPSFSGPEVLKFVRNSKILAKLPFIFVTSLNEIGDVLAALSDGADNYIVKPADPTVVERKIRETMRKVKP